MFPPPLAYTLLATFVVPEGNTVEVQSNGRLRLIRPTAFQASESSGSIHNYGSCDFEAEVISEVPFENAGRLTVSNSVSSFSTFLQSSGITRLEGGRLVAAADSSLPLQFRGGSVAGIGILDGLVELSEEAALQHDAESDEGTLLDISSDLQCSQGKYFIQLHGPTQAGSEFTLVSCEIIVD